MYKKKKGRHHLFLSPLTGKEACQTVPLPTNHWALWFCWLRTSWCPLQQRWERASIGYFICEDVFNMVAMVPAIPTALSKKNFYIHNSFSCRSSSRQSCILPWSLALSLTPHRNLLLGLLAKMKYSSWNLLDQRWTSNSRTANFWAHLGPVQRLWTQSRLGTSAVLLTN